MQKNLDPTNTTKPWDENLISSLLLESCLDRYTSFQANRQIRPGKAVGHDIYSTIPFYQRRKKIVMFVMYQIQTRFSLRSLVEHCQPLEKGDQGQTRLIR